jgi:serine/threonine protein kinase
VRVGAGASEVLSPYAKDHVGITGLLGYDDYRDLDGVKWVKCIYLPMYDITVADLLKTHRRRVCAAQRLLIAYDMCCGFETLHRCNFVHRDMKGNNVMAVYDRQYQVWRAAIIDFGNALNVPAKITVHRLGNTLRECLPELKMVDKNATFELTTAVDVFMCCKNVFERYLFPAGVFVDDCFHKRESVGADVYARIAKVVNGGLEPTPDTRSSFTVLKAQFLALLKREVDDENACVSRVGALHSHLHKR